MTVRSTECFQPHALGVAGVSITVLASSAQVAVPKAEGHATVRLFNSGANVIFVRFGTSASAVAVVTDMALAPNSVEVFSMPEHLANAAVMYIAAIASATGNTLYITPGDGI